MPCSLRMAAIRGSTPRSATFILPSIWRRRHKGLAGGWPKSPLREALNPANAVEVRVERGDPLGPELLHHDQGNGVSERQGAVIVKEGRNRRRASFGGRDFDGTVVHDHVVGLLSRLS